MTHQKANVVEQLTKMVDGFEAAPPSNSSDFQIAAHYYGLCIKAAPALDHAAKEFQQLLDSNFALRAALQAYVDDARSHTDQGNPGTPFAARLAAAEAALK